MTPTPRKKMTIKDLKAIFGIDRPIIPGDPNERTKATTKGHIHKVNPAARPSVGISSKTRARRERIRRFLAKLGGE